MHHRRSLITRLWRASGVGLLALALFSEPAAAQTTQPGTVDTQHFTVDFGDFTSNVELTYPQATAAGNVTVILLHGGCPCDMDETFTTPDGSIQSQLFKDIAYDLASHGIAVVRYNKHYVSSATVFDGDKFGHLTLQQMLADAERVLDATRQNPHVDPTRIVIYGWSEGTVIAAALVMHHPELAGLMVQGVSATPYRDSFITSDLEVALPYLHSFAPDGMITAETLKRAQAGNGGAVKFLLGDFSDPGVPPGNPPAVNPALDTNHDGALDPASEIRPGIGAVIDAAMAPGGPLANYGPGRALPNVAEQAPNLKLPVLILQGDQDVFSVTDGAVLDAALTANPDHTLKTYAGLGHSLGPASSRTDDAFRPIAAAPLADMRAWVLAHTPGAPGQLPRTGGDFDAAPWLAAAALILLALGLLVLRGTRRIAQPLRRP